MPFVCSQDTVNTQRFKWSCMFPLRSEKKGWFLNGLDFINCSIRNPFATMQLSDWQFPHCNGPFRYGSH